MAAGGIRSVDVAIVGGGIMGASIAWQLAKQGAGSVAVFERGTLASGASGRTGALLRRHYTNVEEATLAHRSWEVFANWKDIIGGSCGHDPCGLVVTVETGPGYEDNIEKLHQNVAMQNGIGIPSKVVSPQELLDLQPFITVDDIRAAAYEPNSGCVDSVAATLGMARAARDRSATFVEGAEVTGLNVQGDRVAGIETAEGTVLADRVVVAAGPWSTKLLATAGVTVPISAIRVQVVILHRPLTLEQPHFIFLDTAAGIFTRPWAPGRSLVGVGGGDQHDEVDPEQWEERNSPGYADLAIQMAAKRIPEMANARYLHGHAGLYDMTPDTHPIIGETPVEGLYLAAGFSGAGFKKGPAVGKALAELILEGESRDVSLDRFGLSRFDTDAWKEPWSATEYRMNADFGHGL